MKRTQRQYLVDILEAMNAAERFVEGKEMEDLEDDLQLQWALERAFTIIGEAVNKIDPGLRDQYPDVPWRNIIGMRNRLVHGYWAVKLEVVWEAIHRDFPAARPQLQRVLDELPPEEV